MIGTPASVLEQLNQNESAAAPAQRGKRKANAPQPQPSSLLSQLRMVIVDEADLVLSYGYDADMRQLLSHLQSANVTPQILMFSATFSAELTSFSSLFLRHALQLQVGLQSIWFFFSLTFFLF